MPCSITITLSIAGADTGPFNIYSDVTGYDCPLVTGVSRASLLAGYIIYNVPDDATSVRIESTGACNNYIDILITSCPPSPTPSPTPSPAAATPIPSPAAPTPIPAPVAPTPIPAPVVPSPIAPSPEPAPSPVAPSPVAPSPVAPSPVAPSPIAPSPEPAPSPTPVYYTYDVNDTSYADPAVACSSSDGNLTLYAAESTALTVTVFYTDTSLTNPFSGTGNYYRYQKILLGGSVRAQIAANGAVLNAANCP